MEKRPPRIFDLNSLLLYNLYQNSCIIHIFWNSSPEHSYQALKRVQILYSKFG